LLRPLELDDVDILWPDISDSEISKLMAWEAHTNKFQTVEFLKAEVARRDAGNGFSWAIFLGQSFCGIISLIGLTRGHRALIYNKAELAYWLGLRYHRQGIMTEAARRVLRFAFQDLQLHKVVVGHFGNNEASENIIIRLGFRFIGEQQKEFKKNGIWHNHKIYEILETEFFNNFKN
jgi:[ribosomal protein S5]-alanine N-acetyltransferase